MGYVRGVVEVVLGKHLPKPTRREEVVLRRCSKLEVAQGTVYISRSERSWIRPWRWCRRRQQRSCWGGILHALRACTRILPNTYQTTWATCPERLATSAPLWPSGVGGRRPPLFFYRGGIPPNCADVFIVPVLERIYSPQGWLVHLHNRLMSDEQKKRLAACLDLCLHVHVHMSTY